MMLRLNMFILALTVAIVSNTLLVSLPADFDDSLDAGDDGFVGFVKRSSARHHLHTAQTTCIYSTCYDCTLNACDWCEDTNSCVSTTSLNSCISRLISRMQCGNITCSTQKTCENCTLNTNGSCGWCVSNLRCYYGSISGPLSNNCPTTSWVYGNQSLTCPVVIPSLAQKTASPSSFSDSAMVGVIVGSIFGFLLIMGIILCSCYHCECCPWKLKRIRNAVAPSPMAEVQVSTCAPHSPTAPPAAYLRRGTLRISAMHVSARVLADVLDPASTPFTPMDIFDTHPLIPLAEAVSALEVPNIMDLLAKASDWAKQLPVTNKTMNPNLASAVHLYTLGADQYTNSFHHHLNCALRASDPAQLLPFIPYLRLLIAGMKASPIYTGDAYHGMQRGPNGNFRVGDNFKFRCFASCVSSIDTLLGDEFLGSAGSRTVVQIQCTLGASNITQMASYRDDNEIVLYPGTIVEIIKIEPLKNGAVLIKTVQKPSKNMPFVL